MTAAAKRSSPSLEHASRRARVHPHGLMLEGAAHALPLYCGAMHYWRHPPEAWGPCLDAMKAMGLRLVDTYVPWGVHERGPGVFDFGERDPSLDVAGFVRMCAERGLKVVVRPGPHINAELTFFGLPERIAWDRECQARTPRDNPVMLPMVPVAFPVPSYASDLFHEETARWFRGRRQGPRAAAPPRGADRDGADRQRGGALLPRRPVRSGLPPRRDPPLSHLFACKVQARARAARRVERDAHALRDAHAAEPLRRAPRRGSAAAHGLDGVPRAPLDERDGALLEVARGGGALGAADDAQLPARRGGDAAQRRAHGQGHRSDRPRLLPPGDAAPSHDDPPPHERARQPVRGALGAAVRRRGRRGLSAVLRAARRRGLALHVAVRDGVRPPRVQPVHGGRARSLGGRADRSARPPPRLRRSLPRAHPGARADPLPHAPPPRAGAPARAARAPPPRARDARVRAGLAGRVQHHRGRASRRAASRRSSGSARSRRSPASRTCARSSARCRRAACRSRTRGARASR